MSKKLKLQPDATFKRVVDIPVAGSDEPAQVEFEFKHRSVKEMQAFWDSLEERQNADVIMDIAAGWDLQEPFNKDNVVMMLENYPMSFASVYNGYQDELFKARVGN